MKKSGYTLLEVMIVLVVLGVLSTAIYSMITQGRDAAESVDVRARLTDGARIAITEMTRDLAETSASSVTVDASKAVPYFIDPLNGETHQVLIFASARGDPAAPAEAGAHANNNYVHLDADYKPAWRSVIVYCTYVTPEGIQQLRKYVDYADYSAPGMFPFSFVSVTANAINLQKGNGAGLSIVRSAGVARANYVTSEVTGLSDNNDGVIDNGTDLTISGTLMKIKIFLSERELPTKGGTRRLMVTLTDSVVMRNR